ncbi:MAG: endolytic transglycosylase MltG [Oscillospiraceae bacterium]|nr:endolytic transglycosylase MltG [Oscillospiraceae bacterium]
MNNFSDGFDDRSYEDLLNEYAGEVIGSKSAKRNTEEPVKKSSAAKNTESKKPAVNRSASNTPSKAQKDTRAAASASQKATQGAEQTASKSTGNYSLDLNSIKSRSNDTPKNKYDSKLPASDTTEFRSIDFVERKRRAAASRNIRSTGAVGSRGTASSHSRSGIRKTAERTPVKTTDAASKQNASNKKQKNGKPNVKNIGVALLGFVRTHKKDCIVFVCCLLISIAVSAVMLSCINDVLAINRDDGKSVEVVLPNDADTNTAIKVLSEKGLIKNELFCRIFIKVMGYTDENYLPGVYYFNKSMGIEKMIVRFKTSSQRGATISITIPEGFTIDQIFERLEKNEVCTAASLYKTIDEIDFSSEYDFVKEIDNKEERYHMLEGYFFPATYEFEQGADPASVVRDFLNAFKARWTDEYSERAAELSMSTDDIVRIASIIEKEAYGSDQFNLVSSVLHNRLNRSGVYPTLDCDSTKDYVANTVSGRVKETSKLNAYIRAYNTYECAGLPVGAICNPGQAAIEAALYPDTTQYYFFSHDSNRKIYMASTIEEHNANARTIAQVNAQNN